MAEGEILSIFTADQLAERVLVGGGGFGQIWRARHSVWGVDVALKMLHGTDNRCTENEELLREARLMNALRFQYVVRLLGLYRGPEEPLGIVMEFMENGSLASLQEKTGVPGTLKVRLIHEVALGMNYLHSLPTPLLHLDLNPRNVLLDDGLHAKIAVFGLSKLKQIASSLPVSSVAGTTEYLAPEAMSLNINQYKPTPAMDVYSFGILVWSVLSGKQPYQGKPRVLIVINIPKNQRPDLSLLPRPETLEKLEDLTALMQECWHNEPQERPTFAVCRDRTEMVFRYHRADVSDAVHRVGNVLRNQDTSSCVGGFSESMRDLSLRDSATDPVGELRTEYSTRPDPPTLPEPLPSLGTRPPMQEETPNNQSSGPKLSTTKSGSSQLDGGMARGPEVKDSQKGKPTNQKMQVTGTTRLGSIQILSSNIEGLQVGDRNTMNVSVTRKGKKKSKR